MKYINTFKTYASYEEKLNVGGVDISLPNISYCEDVKDVNYNPYNTVEFYVGEITSPQTVKIYTDKTNHVDVQVSEGNKWYSYLLPKDKGLYKIEGDSVKKVVVKADITTSGDTIISKSTIEASFKGSNTSNVTNMNSMFTKCSGLTSLDLRNFNTSNVTDMDSVFKGCKGLKSLDVSSFDTSKVTDMGYMFQNCSKITYLNLSNFNTSNVKDMNSMFEGCNSLTSLDLSRFNTSKVTDMGYMFDVCKSLTSLDLSGWNMSNVTNMDSMFYACPNLSTIRMASCNQTTINKIKAVKPSSATIITE